MARIFFTQSAQSAVGPLDRRAADSLSTPGAIFPATSDLGPGGGHGTETRQTPQIEKHSVEAVKREAEKNNKQELKESL